MSSHSRSDSTSEREYEDQSDRSKNEQSAADHSAEGAPDLTKPTTTVMIYLAGDNNLTDECIYALTELKKAKASRLVKIFVQFDPSDEFLPTQRYEINRHGRHRYNCPLAEDLIDQFPFKETKNSLKIKPPYGEQRERKGESGTGDPRMLFNFVAFCVDEHPKTDHYVLIICGHGAGIQRDFLLRDNRPDGYLTIYELRAALKLMRKRLRGKDPNREFKLDLFGMDVCLMSMVEITYELRGLVDIAIGCESYSPAAGWPYFQTIQQIDTEADNKRLSATGAWEMIAKNIVTEYIRFYSDYWLGGLSVSMSALKVNQVDELRHLIRGLANEMIRELRQECDEKHIQLYGMDNNGDRNEDEGPADSECRNEAPDPHCQLEMPSGTEYDKQWKRKRYPPLSFSDALLLAHWRTQSYNGELYVDLADFCDNLAQYLPRDNEIAYLCEKLSHFIKHDFVIKSCTFGRNYQYSYGVSIYFPWQTLIPYYGASISFPEDSDWILFLRLYLIATRREPRLFYSKPHGGFRELVDQNLSQVRMGPDRMGPDRMGLDEGGNPIHSMRNPPIVFMPDCCTSSDRRRINARAQSRLMKDPEFDPKELLRDARIRKLEEANPAWVLLTEEPAVTPEQLEADNADEN